MPHIEALAFDFDGVLADSDRIHTATRIEAFERSGYTVNPEIHAEAHYRGTTTPQIIGWILQTVGEVDGNLTIDELGEDPRVQQVTTLKRQLYNREAAAGLPAIPGSLDFVRRAVRRYGADRLAIATTASKKNEVEPYLGRHGLDSAFTVVLGSEYVPDGLTKPNPFVYQKVCEVLQVPAINIAAIEDSPRGVRAALDAHYGAVYGIISTHERSQLSEATEVVDSYTTLSMRLL